MGLAASLTAMFALIAASCSVQFPEDEELGQSESALATGWQATTPLPEQRRYHSATVLSSDKVLVVGGWSYNSMLAQAVAYEPASATWSPAGVLALGREAHTATRLSSGKVLVAGGETSDPYPNNYTNTAELYDPATNSWSPAGTISQARGYNTATLLSTTPEKVLVVGGQRNGPLNTVDLYNTATGTWSPAASLLEPRRSHTAVRLASGKVLVAGGWAGGALATTELYEPSTNTWTAGRPLTTARYGHTATELPGGKILVVGGQKISAPGTVDFTATAELYDPSTGTWTSAGSLSAARGFHTATLVAGKVLVAGGQGPGNATLATVELYDPSANTWSSTNSMLGARSDHAAVYSNPVGKVLIIGGSNNSALATTELYDSCGLITCNTPPSQQCYAANGTCSKGTCSYAPLSAGALCNDSNACTTGDTCNGSGGCSGTALSCSTASTNYCSGNNVRRTTGTGSCSGGVCTSTDSFVQTCATGTSSPFCSGNSVYQTVNGGCSGGACTSTQQFVQTCSTASTNYCSGNDVRNVTGTGCANGSCRSNDTFVETCSTGSGAYCSGNDLWEWAGNGCSGGSCDYSDNFVRTCPTGTSSPFCSGNNRYQTVYGGCSGSSCQSTQQFLQTCPTGTTVTCTTSGPQTNSSGAPTTAKVFVSTQTTNSGCSGTSCVSTSTSDVCENQEECSGSSACTTLNLENNYDFVKVTFRDILKREPDSSGWNWYVNTSIPHHLANQPRCQSFGTTSWQCKYAMRAAVAQDILQSPESASKHPGLTGDRCGSAYKRVFIIALYEDLLQRTNRGMPIPSSGVDFWMGFDMTGCVNDPASPNGAHKYYERLIFDFITSSQLEYPRRWGHTVLQ